MFDVSKRIVLLDRDGVINHDSDDYIRSPEEWVPIEGSLEAIALLNQHDFDIHVITNQSGIGRGYFTRETLDAMHEKMDTLLSSHRGRVGNVMICPHGLDAVTARCTSFRAWHLVFRA